MKKIICLSVVLLILAGVGCAAMSPKTTLTKENQATLKGTWSGTADFRSGQQVIMVMEITNDAPPCDVAVLFAGQIHKSGLKRITGF
jgi:hypothetical protein